MACRLAILLACVVLLPACGDGAPFSVTAVYRPQSNAYSEVQVYAGGWRGFGDTDGTNVTVLLKTLEGKRRVLRLRMREADLCIAADVPGTIIRRGLPLDAALMRRFLPESFDEAAEEHLPGEAAELVRIAKAAIRGKPENLPQTKHLILSTAESS